MIAIAVLRGRGTSRMSPQTTVAPVAERRLRRPRPAESEFHTLEVEVSGRGRPVRRPSALGVTGGCRPEERHQHSLSASQVQQAAGGGQDGGAQKKTEDGIPAELALREVPRIGAAPPVGERRRLDHFPEQGVSHPRPHRAKPPSAHEGRTHRADRARLPARPASPPACVQPSRRAASGCPRRQGCGSGVG